MIRLTLNDDQRAGLLAARRDPTFGPPERDRVEMVLLSAAGWSPPAIAQHLGYCAATVRTVLKGFPRTGVAGLRRQRSGPPKDLARRAQVLAALDRRLDQPRTWTAAQLAAALQEEGIRLSTRQTRKYLRLLGARWRRTARSLRHKQDPARVERAERVLAHLKKGRRRANSSSPLSTNAASPPACR
jgi:putative transposase